MAGEARRPCLPAVRGGGSPPLLLAALLAATSGCSLLLDFSQKSDAGPEDDADVIDAGPVGDGGDPCNAFEPNDSLAAAYPIESGSYAPLAVCPAGDHDYFRFTLGEAQDMVVEALFANMGGAGDLEMRLYDGTGEDIDRSETFSDNERIERSLAQSNQLTAGEYTVEMYGFNETTTNDYTLVLTITAP